MRTIKGLVVHTTATPWMMPVTVADITKWHRERGFKTVGYHIVIYHDGTVVRGRPDAMVGAHVYGWNADTIGICYVGGLDKDGRPADTRTGKQKAALVQVLNSYVRSYPSVEYICGHRDLSPDVNGDGIIEKWEWVKECPCFNAIPAYRNLLPGAKPIPSGKGGLCGWTKSLTTTSPIGR